MIVMLLLLLLLLLIIIWCSRYEWIFLSRA